jgi:hypothetical protein
LGQIANTLNRREEGKLPSKTVANPNGHYTIEEVTSYHQQVLAIATLQSGRRVDNHVQEKKDEQIETPQNLQKEKSFIKNDILELDRLVFFTKVLGFYLINI